MEDYFRRFCFVCNFASSEVRNDGPTVIIDMHKMIMMSRLKEATLNKKVVMRISDICFDQLKRFEGLRNEAYYDPAGVLTIGYGHTGPDVRPGDVISKYWAEHLLKADLYDVEKAVSEMRVAITQPQFDALVSFAFNLGVHKLKTSTLLKTIREGGSMHDIKAEFKRWVYAGGKVQKGLVRRREWEASRFFNPDEMEPMKRRDWSGFHKKP